MQQNKPKRVEKVIYWKLCKRLNSDHATKCYMHRPESVLENETHKILWDFKVQTDYLISVRRLDQVLINKQKKNISWILPFRWA